MISHATLENLRGMRCSAMATAFQQQLDDPKTYGQLGFEERFSLIVDAEWNRRQANKLNKLIRDSAFSENTASIEAIEYLPDRKLDKSQILRFATCKYMLSIRILGILSVSKNNLSGGKFLTSS